jgi:hypothetical protein
MACSHRKAKSYLKLCSALLRLYVEIDDLSYLTERMPILRPTTAASGVSAFSQAHFSAGNYYTLLGFP